MHVSVKMFSRHSATKQMFFFPYQTSILLIYRNLLLSVPFESSGMIDVFTCHFLCHCIILP